MRKLRDEIPDYIDVYGLVSPHRAANPKRRESDNGVLFTSEYYIQLLNNGELTAQDKVDYETLIRSCMLEPGLISRVPGDDGQSPPDDQYGVSAACSQLGITSIPADVVSYGLRHFGSFNNKDRTWTTRSFLWRQLPLVAAQYAAARRGRLNPVVWCLNAITALIIATSCRGIDRNNTDARKLSYLLIKAMQPVSVLCRLASVIWKRRAERDYGPEFLSIIYTIYFETGHPLARWSKY